MLALPVASRPPAHWPWPGSVTAAGSAGARRRECGAGPETGMRGGLQSCGLQRSVLPFPLARPSLDPFADVYSNNPAKGGGPMKRTHLADLFRRTIGRQAKVLVACTML